MTNHAKGLLLGLVSALVWGTQYSITRFIFGESNGYIEPNFMSMVKFLSGAVALMPMLWIDNGWQKCRQALREMPVQMMGLAMLGGVLEGLPAFISLKYTTAARSSLLCNTSPVWTVLVAAIAVRRCPRIHVLIGVMLGFGGLALALSAQASDMYTDGGSSILGDALAILSGISWGSYTALGVKSAKKYGGIPCTFLTLLLSTFYMLPFCFFHGVSWLGQTQLSTWLVILYLGIGSTGLGIAVWYTALKYVPPESLGGYGYLSACIAMAMARVAAKEHFPWQFIAAFILIIGGLMLMGMKQRKRGSDGMNTPAEAG